MKQAKHKTAPVVHRTVDLEPRTFRYRKVWFHAGMCRVFAVLFLLPFVVAAGAVALAFNGMAGAWTAAGVSISMAVPFGAMTWVLWRMGDRIANGGVIVDDTGVDVYSAYANDKFAWEEITAISRQQREWGYRGLYTVWFLCLHSEERVLQIDPWVQSPNELATLICRATGLKVVDLPLV